MRVVRKMNNINDPFYILGISPTNDKNKIKKAYASKVKLIRPDTDPEGFKRIHDAYKAALSGSLMIEQMQAKSPRTNVATKDTEDYYTEGSHTEEYDNKSYDIEDNDKDSDNDNDTNKLSFEQKLSQSDLYELSIVEYMEKNGLYNEDFFVKYTQNKSLGYANKLLKMYIEITKATEDNKYLKRFLKERFVLYNMFVPDYRRTIVNAIKGIPGGYEYVKDTLEDIEKQITEINKKKTAAADKYVSWTNAYKNLSEIFLYVGAHGIVFSVVFLVGSFINALSIGILIASIISIFLSFFLKRQIKKERKKYLEASKRLVLPEII